MVDASERLLTNCFLVVCQQQPAELFPLKEVLAVVLGLGHGKQVLVQVRLVLFRHVELEPDARVLRGCLLSISGGGVKRDTSVKVAHVFAVVDLARPMRLVLLIHSRLDARHVETELFFRNFTTSLLHVELDRRLLHLLIRI